MIVDSHIHLWEFSKQERSYLCGRKDLVMIAVSDDLRSSLTTLEISSECPNASPAVGIHPWEVGEASIDDLRKVIELVSKAEVVGEVGLDRIFVPGTINKQLKFFTELVNAAVRLNKPLSIHAAGAWEDVINILESAGAKAVIIHWFTGPLHLLKRIEDLGYFIGVNPAAIIQRKSRQVIRSAPLEIILTESDGPYEYRGMRLEPDLITKLMKLIAELRGLKPNRVKEIVIDNFNRFVNLSGLSRLRKVTET